MMSSAYKPSGRPRTLPSDPLASPQHACYIRDSSFLPLLLGNRLVHKTGPPENPSSNIKAKAASRVISNHVLHRHRCSGPLQWD
jgi:hypothetical protein